MGRGGGRCLALAGPGPTPSACSGGSCCVSFPSPPPTGAGPDSQINKPCLQNPRHQPSAQLTSQVTALSPLAYHHHFHFRPICPPLAAVSPELSLNYTAQVYNHFWANILSSFAFSPSTAQPQARLSPISCPLHLCPERSFETATPCCACAGF